MIYHAVERGRWCSSLPRARSMSAMSTGMVDPIYAIDKGAPIAIVRLEVQSPPYALIAKPAIKSLKDLKGKIIIARRPEGHHQDLCRADAGDERRQAG